MAQKISFLQKDQRKTIGEVSVDATTIYDLLKAINPEEVITYDAISEAIGRPIKKNIGLLYTALNMAKTQDSMVFDCVRKVGYRRLNDSQIAQKSNTQPFRKIRATVRRAVKDIGCIDKSNISNEEHISVNFSLSVFGVMKSLSSSKPSEQKEEYFSDPLPVGKTLEFFKNN
jgi:alkylated DNA nucleotide flippase Atl1